MSVMDGSVYDYDQHGKQGVEARAYEMQKSRCKNTKRRWTPPWGRQQQRDNAILPKQHPLGVINIAVTPQWEHKNQSDLGLSGD